MRDLIRDWQRWTRSERLAVVLLGTFLLTGVTTAVAANLYATLTGRAPSEMETPF